MTLTKEQTEDLIGMSPEVRGLVKTIIDAAAALARLLPDKELEQGFEFPWGHLPNDCQLFRRESIADLTLFSPDFNPRT